MKSKIKKLKFSIGFVLVIEAILVTVIVGLSFWWAWLIYLNVGVGYLLFVLHLIVYLVRKKLISKRFQLAASKEQLFAGYIEKRNYQHNSLILYTSFFVIVFVLMASLVSLFLSRKSNEFALDLLSLFSAALVITSPFLGTFYRKITNIAQTEGDMKKNALKKDIKFLILNNNSLNKAMADIDLTKRTIILLAEEGENNSSKIVSRLQNRIDNINEQISLFEIYLVFESTIKTITSKSQVKQFKNEMLSTIEIDQVFAVIQSYQNLEY